jgi:hypothetical protein
MTTLTHREAVGYLRQTPSTVTLRYYVPTAAEREIAEAKATSPKVHKYINNNNITTLIEHP